MNNQNKGEAMEAKVIKTWQERVEESGMRGTEHKSMLGEIADLRAALASAQEEIAGLRGSKSQSAPNSAPARTADDSAKAAAANAAGLIVAWRCNRLDHNGKVVQRAAQRHPWPIRDHWEYFDDLNIADELRGLRGLKASDSHVNWQPLYDRAPAANAADQPTLAWLVDPGAGSAMDKLQRYAPDAMQLADIKARGGSVTELVARAAATSTAGLDGAA